MKSTEKRNLWQCAKLFRRACPNHKDPAMKLVIVLVQEMFNDMTVEAIQAAEVLCVSCPDFSQKSLHSEK